MAKVLHKISLDVPPDTGRDFLTKLMGGRLNQQLEDLLAEKKYQCLQAIQPQAIYDLFEIEKIKGESVWFSSGHRFNGPNNSKILLGSKLALIYICTLGHQVDQLIKQNSESGDTLSTIVMDAVTTSFLTLLGEQFATIARQQGLQQPGWQATCSYSPGQYKWTIEEQKEIFKMVDGSQIGVNLNPSYLMMPFKSISGVYGFGPEHEIDKTRVACQLCPRHDCISRRT